MAGRKPRKASSAVPTSTSAPVDLISLLPKEIRLRIYSFVFEPVTLQIEKRWRISETPSGSSPSLQCRYSAVLSMRRDIRCRKFSARLDQALFKALQWTQNHSIVSQGPVGGPSTNKIIIRIIYELTGQQRLEHQVNIEINSLIGRQRRLKPKRSDLQDLTVNEKLPKIAETARYTIRLIEKLRNLQVRQNSLIDEQVDAIQAAASKLVDDIDRERAYLAHMAVLKVPNTALDGNINIFRDLSSFATDSKCEFGLYLNESLPTNHLSLASVDHFYRSDSLPVLASSIVYDFGDDVKTLHTFYQALKPASRTSMRNVRLIFAEGHMSDAMAVITSLSSLRTLHIDLWPRNPMRADAGDRSWGKDTKEMLKFVSTIDIRVVIELRWFEDCEYFEREYTDRSWQRLHGSDVVDTDEREQTYGMCQRFYQLVGKGEME